ncbi:S-adenosyl-L-methionine-dependent methyltransferases superfamily protein [Artemisia annua]|uniref:S-adenosyl-L-methionine-dependent methyltransferases superfamily protein n=1 Tax=Artemisia annua TaxID=35608 RepID=A0A2U1LR66_ARTAN|nr:S-adenosyl-L-methionine-dependent methyltransferases superfamily protein [Artemisia annua]
MENFNSVDDWPPSLKNFITTSSSLAFPREQADLEKLLPNMQMASLNNVITQGMNQKKRHEIEALAAVVSSVARDVETNTVIDLGAGQGYLSQVLSFEYNLSVMAIDASSHHGNITHARAERIKKHYDAKMRKSSLGGRDVTIPKTVTCRVLSSDMLKTLLETMDVDPTVTSCHSKSSNDTCSLLLTGLHACGDLSVTMLRTFLECKEVKAVVSIGCCYNLLSEEESEQGDALCGFPVSQGVKSTCLHLGKSSRDLACQSADRWKCMEKDASLHNFELHAFRAAFQMVLSRYFPETLNASPTVGRQGKALRRKQQRMLVSTNHPEETFSSQQLVNSNLDVKCCGAETDVTLGKDKNVDRCSLFENFSLSAMHRLKTNTVHDIDFAGIWKEAEPFAEMIGPYWSLRATLGPVLETLILLDRLLFLQEQGDSVEVVMLPIFNPSVSPRNVALIAKKV